MNRLLLLPPFICSVAITVNFIGQSLGECGFYKAKLRIVKIDNFIIYISRMKPINNTSLITDELNLYIEENRYFDKKKEEASNDEIFISWVTKFRLALAEDIQSAFKNSKVTFLLSEFELVSEDERGACLFSHKIILSDIESLEFIKANIKTLVAYNQTTLYLDSTYANTSKWEGKSKILKTIFERLKTADKQFGYFSPINLQDFIK